MKDFIYKFLNIGILSGSLLLDSYAYSQINYPYSSGQAVFVQSPYTSSLYTNYRYDPRANNPNRLPPYTTNQAVFVQQPYATTQQTITSYPSLSQFNLPYSENRYTSPNAYPATIAPIFPMDRGRYASSLYTTTNQEAGYNYPYASPNYTTTEIYPYTTSRQFPVYPPPTVQTVNTRYPVTTYNAYPTTTVVQYPYPMTTTAVPENIIQPAPQQRNPAGR